VHGQVLEVVVARYPCGELLARCDVLSPETTRSKAKDYSKLLTLILACMTWESSARAGNPNDDGFAVYQVVTEARRARCSGGWIDRLDLVEVYNSLS
jgi:hypothetical protein